MSAMIIEYIGEVIRNEITEMREKMYEKQNRGVYMFRCDAERVVDATMTGGTLLRTSCKQVAVADCQPSCLLQDRRAT